MNKRKEPANREVSVYIEGIGTENFVEGAVKRDKKGDPLKDQNGQTVKLLDEENGNDDSVGYALGSGTTGIFDKVTKGIVELRKRIEKLYKPGPKGKEYVSKLVVDVVGFSRGAAAARHFMARRGKLQEGWPKQGKPEIEINFVGLYDTVSSYESLKGAGGDGALYLASLGLVPGPFGIPVPLNPHVFSTDTIFGDDVLQLGLDLGSIPKNVVHLTARDEYRENFSLTNINTSLKAKVGVEVSLPGAHSDIGGGYAEGTRHNVRREHNKEVRRIHDAAEKQQLIRDGWYLPHQFEPWRQYHTPAIPSVPVMVPLPFPFSPVVLRTPAVKSYPVNVWENGVRYLTHEYQFVALFIMLGFATRGGRHAAMRFESLTNENAQYQVPSDLVALRDHFDREVRQHDGGGDARQEGELSLPAIECPTPAQTHQLRNQYLHRSARLITELKVGMAGREDAGRKDRGRRIIPDDILTEKRQDTARRVAKEKAAQAHATVHDKLNRLRGQANRALELLKDGAKKGLEELGKHPPPPMSF